jgi:hypothetical protein
MPSTRPFFVDLLMAGGAVVRSAMGRERRDGEQHYADLFQAVSGAYISVPCLYSYLYRVRFFAASRHIDYHTHPRFDLSRGKPAGFFRNLRLRGELYIDLAFGGLDSDRLISCLGDRASHMVKIAVGECQP